MYSVLESDGEAVSDNIHPFVKTEASVKNVPVVYVWFTKAPLPDYFEKTAKASTLNNDVIVLVQSGQRFKTFQSSKVSFVDLNLYLAPADSRFFEDGQKGHYQHWGLNEPGGTHDTQRAFALSQYMEKNKHHERLFYADCDVAVLANVTQLYHTNYVGCSSVLNIPEHTFESFFWAGWIGSAFLSRSVLKDFAKFTKQMYSSPYFGLLEEKKKHPYVCDMTLWYLYAAAVGVVPDAKGKVTLPHVEKTNLCNGQTVTPQGGGHFDWAHGYDKPGFYINEDGQAFYPGKDGRWTQLYTLHFQGPEKSKAPTILRKLL